MAPEILREMVTVSRISLSLQLLAIERRLVHFAGKGYPENTPRCPPRRNSGKVEKRELRACDDAPLRDARRNRIKLIDRNQRYRFVFTIRIQRFIK